MVKTNACRILDANKIDYILKTKDEIDKDLYLHENSLIFKTLVTVSNTGSHYVFVIPIDAELDLKKCAKEVGAKSIEMIKQKELLPLTGYIHGGCSPIGMKKEFETLIDEYATLCDRICVSAGDVDLRMIVSPNDIINVLKKARFADLTQ